MFYYILDAAADEFDDDNVRTLASSANPFLFKDIGSADPAIYIEFKQAWDKEFGENAEIDFSDCKDFIKNYLLSFSSIPRDTFNIVVDEDTWVEDMKEVKLQSESRIKSVNS
jgi:hypothetical protein